jgi:hypothetical protein
MLATFYLDPLYIHENKLNIYCIGTVCFKKNEPPRGWNRQKSGPDMSGTTEFFVNPSYQMYGLQIFCTQLCKACRPDYG